MECSDLPGWERVLFDPHASAGSYATFGALLAGFALSGLIWIATSDSDEREKKSVPAVGMLSTLVPLVGATLFYAELDGDQNCETAFLLAYIASFVLALGTVALLLSLVQLLGSLFDDVADRFGEFVSITAVLLGTLTIYVGNNSLNEVFSSEQWSWSLEEWAQIVVLLAGITGGAIRAFRSQPVVGSVPAFAYVVLIGSAGFVLFYAVSLNGSSGWTPAFVSWSRTIGWTVFVLAASRSVRIPSAS